MGAFRTLAISGLHLLIGVAVVVDTSRPLGALAVGKYRTGHLELSISPAPTNHPYLRIASPFAFLSQAVPNESNRVERYQPLAFEHGAKSR